MWTRKTTIAVGGLENIGYVDNQDFLVCMSSQGYGIFDCILGERIARLKYPDISTDIFNEKNSTIQGFDFLRDVTIKSYGLFGGDGMPKQTTDRWKMVQSGSKIKLLAPDGQESTSLYNDDVCELRAFGFSPTNKTLVIASSCELQFFTRM